MKSALHEGGAWLYPSLLMCSILFSSHLHMPGWILCAVICIVATVPWHVLGPSFSAPLKWICHRNCAMEGSTSTVRDAEYPQAIVPFFTSALLSTTCKAQPPSQCAPVDCTLARTLIPTAHTFHPCPRHSRWGLEAQAVSSISAVFYHFQLVAWCGKCWEIFGA